jgi:hypothetical protein
MYINILREIVPLIIDHQISGKKKKVVVKKYVVSQPFSLVSLVGFAYLY